MRRQTAAMLGIALGMVAAGATPFASAQGQPARRPQSKILVYQPPTDQPAVVGVMGQVQQPGTYQFASAPTLERVIAAADGFTPTASSMVRLVRNQRVAQRMTLPASAQEKLQPGDLVIVDPQPLRSGAAVPAGDQGVQLAFLGIHDRPLIVRVKSHEAKPQIVVQMLGQPAEVLSSLRGISPPTRELEANPAARNGMPATLADGTVLIFDRQRMLPGELPDNLPKILPCSLPEPDIGAYGIHNALDERPRTEISERDRIPPAEPIPFPTSESSREIAPTPLPQFSDQVPATFSSSERSGAGSAPVSTLPFSGSTTIAARRSRLTESAPPEKSSAADAKEPSWHKVAPPTDDDLLIDDGKPGARRAAAKGAPFSVWQMLAIVSCAGLLVGVGLAVRASQQRERSEKTIDVVPAQSGQAAIFPVRQRIEPKATIPAPHIPLQSFAASAAPPTIAATAAASESLEIRQARFLQLLKNELPMMEEPLALRPGMLFKPASPPKPVRRTDSGAASERQSLIDAPHSRLASGPHLPIGVQAPVERALRQLQGGRS